MGWHSGKQAQNGGGKAPAVKVSVMLLFNNEVYDLLSQKQQRGKIRFKKQINHLQNSKNYGHEYEQIQGVHKMEVIQNSDLNLIVKIAQNMKMQIAERMKMEVADLTQQSSLVVRCEWLDNKTDTRAKMFDFVEMPVTNILLTKKDIPANSTEIARQGNRSFVLDQYNVLQ